MRVAIIPARGGSKRIPRKNIKEFCGKPIISYSIEAAISSGCFDRVIVSTDDEDIAKVARTFGAEIPFTRPEQLSDDFATTLDVIQHSIAWCENQEWKIDVICCIYATAPFIRQRDIRYGLSVLEDPKVQYAFSATSFGFPIQRAFYLDSAGSVVMFQPENINARSQDLRGAYHDAGQFYCGKVSAFKGGLPVFAEHSKPVLLPRERVQDIDTAADWSYAEKMFELLKNESLF